LVKLCKIAVLLVSFLYIKYPGALDLIVLETTHRIV